jgi:hypothetical protein
MISLHPSTEQCTVEMSVGPVRTEIALRFGPYPGPTLASSIPARAG